MQNSEFEEQFLLLFSPQWIILAEKYFIRGWQFKGKKLSIAQSLINL